MASRLLLSGSVRVLITGITGFAGSHLAEHILAEHPDVALYGTYRWRSRMENLEELARRRAEQGASLYEVLLRAAQHYRAQLKDAAHAIAYLKKRGVSGEIAKRFGIAEQAQMSYMDGVEPARYGDNDGFLNHGRIIHRPFGGCLTRFLRTRSICPLPLWEAVLFAL